MKKKRKLIIAIVILLIIGGAIAAFALFGKTTKEVEISTAMPEEGSIEILVTATGEIQPVYKVDVGTQVSGIVKKLYVDYNSNVEKGDLLAELDKSTLQEQVKQAQANLSDAQSNLDLAQKNFDRIKTLYENKAATQESYENAYNTLVQAKNKIVTAKSNAENAKTNLSYAEIYSPISGVILSKAVEEGQTVASSFSTPTLFTIANDLTQMQVEANVDEADIGQVKVGQQVTFTVDAFPDDVFSGEIKQVRLEPTVTSNVVTYTVIITAPNPDKKLFPGMTASVSIVVQKETGIVIPMEATYFEMNENIMELIKKKGLTIAEPENNHAPKDFDRQEAKGEKPMPHKNANDKFVWIKSNNELKQARVELGINDGANTLVTSGINLEDEIVISISEVEMKRQKSSNSNPFMPGPPSKKSR